MVVPNSIKDSPLVEKDRPLHTKNGNRMMPSIKAEKPCVYRTSIPNFIIYIAYSFASTAADSSSTTVTA